MTSSSTAHGDRDPAPAGGIPHDPRSIGRLGEDIAMWFLRSRSCEVLARNVRIGADEIDLVVRDGSDVVAVEVKTSTTGDDPLLMADDRKIERVWRASAGYPHRIRRIDLIAIVMSSTGADVRWLPGVR
jgi:putative endonuclease